MSSARIGAGGLIDRSRRLSFRFDGKDYHGHPGDTVASALLANGVRVMGRSFKYHRPRSVWSSWFDDPNAIFNIRLNGAELSNCLAATTPLMDGMDARAVNAFPSANFDIKGGLDLFNRFLPAGFYYKTFMWPNWHLFEPGIRKMAGLGALDSQEIEGYQADQTHDRCDLLVVGGGVAGLTAAQAAAASGLSVVLVDDHPVAGGNAYQSRDIAGQAPGAWVKAAHKAIEDAGGRVMLKATAFGVYDHQLVAIAQDRGFGQAPRLIRMRPDRCVMATGAMDRPLTFANNDLPGVMSLNGAADYLARYGVLVGNRIAVMAPHNLADDQIHHLQKVGATIDVIDPSEGPATAVGRKSVRQLRVGAKSLDCDTILTSAGLTPVVHLWRHAGGKLRWDETAAAFVPGTGPDWITACGSANGTHNIDDILDEAEAAGLGKPPPPRSHVFCATPPEPVLGAKTRQWIDLQHDVTVKDIELAARENYVSVEHLKRYTTLGMASDQGKTSNVSGLGAMAALQGKSIPEVGTTTFRPPFVPVPLELYRGAHRGQQVHPLKRLALESQHRAAGAALGEYGGWLRPGWYGEGDAHANITREILMARQSAGVFDASPLGKIEVMGPDAEDFVNFIYYNTIKTLAPGNIRYGFMLTEGGVVYDDGVIARMDQNRFVISCSSSHVEGVYGMLESWRQDGNDPDRIFVHDTTQHWSTVTVSGPKARDIVGALKLDIDISAAAFPHMTWRAGQFNGSPVRAARVSFTGDTSFELSIASSMVGDLWEATLDIARAHDAGPIGVEALSVMRAEKGYLIIGKDTDGETMPHDLGFGLPRQKKKAAFVGDRGLWTDAAKQTARRRLVGLTVPDGALPLPTGAHVVVPGPDGPVSSGYVSSSYRSPTLGHPIALGMVTADLAQAGTEVELFHLGQRLQARVTAPCFFDPEGARLNAQ
ncbi:MAG: glycine cleavage T C-terminal barrel domain-containing protein [Sedimentitalea sp.]